MGGGATAWARAGGAPRPSRCQIGDPTLLESSSRAARRTLEPRAVGQRCNNPASARTCCRGQLRQRHEAGTVQHK